MNEKIGMSADAVARFCRLQMNMKKDLPIRSSEMGTLIFVKREGTVTPLIISEFFKIAKPSVTSMVNALVKNEYLVKEPSKTDKRSYTVTVSPKGLELCNTTYREYFSTMEMLEEQMGAQNFNQFIDLLINANGILETRNEG